MSTATTINAYIIPGIVEDINIEKANYYAHAIVGLLPNSNTRRREFVIPRQVAMSIAYVFSAKSLKEVGDMFGRDHATVIYALQNMSNAVDVNDGLVMNILRPVFTRYYNRYQRLRELKAVITDAERAEINIARERLMTYDFSRKLIIQMEDENDTL